METLKLLLKILKDFEIQSMENLVARTKYSERKLRSLISELRKIGVMNGFEVITVKNEGYILKVVDKENYLRFIEQIDEDVELDMRNKDIRILLILYYLIRSKEFFTLDMMSKLLDVSTRTITNDLSNVKEILKENELTLYSKAHYGIKIIGEEINIRKFFSKVTNQIHEYNQNYSLNDSLAILEQDEGIKKLLIEVFSKNNILMTAASFDSIMLHLSILLYRVKESNYVTDISVNEKVIDERYYNAAKEVIRYLQETYKMKVSKPEVDLLASQFFGKSILEDAPEQTRSEMLKLIHQTLYKIDVEYDSKYSEDEVLSEDLLLHIYPLIMRLSFDLELSNSLIHILPAQYTSAFLVALRFSEYHPDLQKYSLSRDEIGYLALHFANHQERVNLRRIQGIKSIAVVYSDMRGDSSLLQTKIKFAFPNAYVRLIPYSKMEKYDLDDVEIILSTNEEIKLKKHTFVIHEPFDDKEINKVKDAVLYNYDTIVHKSIQISDLFYKELYFHESGTDYIKIIHKYASILEREGYSKKGFVESVLERERRLNTIYENGIAGPHSIIPYANIECIVVIILNKPICYDDKTVKCIFLINIRSGHMMLHQSVSQFIVKLMSDKNLIDQVIHTDSLESFNEIMK